MPERPPHPTLPLPDIPDLNIELARLVKTVPSGSVTTYGDLAKALGSRHAAVCVSRWVVEQSRGDASLLQRVVRQGDVGARPRIAKFDVKPVLAPLQEWLRRAAVLVKDQSSRRRPRCIAGIDVAYPAPDRAIAVGVTIDIASRTVLQESAVELPVKFPYIPGLLAFRELPAMMAAYDALCAAGPPPDVVMIDGQGRLHPDRGGIATAFAAATGVSTIGVAKSLLCGKIDKSWPAQGKQAVRPVLDRDELLGHALHSDGACLPIYVSVGGWMSLDEALNLTLAVMDKTRLPIPTHLADARSKKAARGRPS